jgi:hypothetical protein
MEVEMKPIDLIQGFAPTREVKGNDDGTFTITVTPPSWVGAKGKSVILNQDQYIRYLQWRSDQGILIQDALPDLNNNQREILLNGDPL